MRRDRESGRGSTLPLYAPGMTEMPGCPGLWHGPTNNAWNNGGCRHPEAIAAHQAFLAERRNTARTPRWPSDPRPGCPVLHHDTRYAHKVYGCRCDAAVAARDDANARTRQLRATGGGTPVHQGAPPRRNPRRKSVPIFADPDMRVSRFNLLLLTSGFIDNPTRGEMMVATLRLSRRGLTNTEIAARLGTYGADITRSTRLINELRALRTERRLADAQRRHLTKHADRDRT